MGNRKAIDETLADLFAAERTVRQLHDQLAEQSGDDLLEALTASLAVALREPDESEATLRLVRISALLGELEGPRVVDALIDIIASDHLEARRAAGEELEELSFERFKEVALGVERALKRLPVGSPALSELPYILAEVPEPGVTKLLGQFLAHSDPDAVAAAIESLVEIGDPGTAQMLEPLVDDKRTVEMAEEGDEGTTEVTIGELASEALDILGDWSEDDAEEEAEPVGPNRRGKS